MVGKMPLGVIVGAVVSGVFMVAGYFFAEGVMYHSWAAAALGIPWNVGQFVIGLIIAGAITLTLQKTPARKFFAYRFD